ncbi:hypothetical protein [Streptobacillus moniliformis]|uniref:hypothetical protein n=1 Tax=Streptobacillus moniliformis TaxID=34105 RepID=UPI0007E49FCD|nr:hypothetical protein [Streptobacillus moniliformis]
MDDADYSLVKSMVNSVDTSRFVRNEDLDDYAAFVKEKFYELYDKVKEMNSQIQKNIKENEELKKEINELKTEIELLKQEKNYDDYYSLDL